MQPATPRAATAASWPVPSSFESWELGRTRQDQHVAGALFQAGRGVDRAPGTVVDQLAVKGVQAAPQGAVRTGADDEGLLRAHGVRPDRELDKIVDIGGFQFDVAHLGCCHGAWQQSAGGHIHEAEERKGAHDQYR